MADDIEAVVFDLGGVIARFDGVRALARLLGDEDLERVWAVWLASPWVRRFERGDCTAAQFAAGVVAEWAVELSAEQLLASFRGWLGDPLPGAEQLVREVAGRTRVAALSNTNTLHWSEQIAGWPVMAVFAPAVMSFRVGMVKPDREIFELVLGELATPPARTLFLDDSAINVAAAREVGLRAVRVQGPQQARAALTQARLV